MACALFSLFLLLAIKGVRRHRLVPYIQYGRAQAVYSSGCAVNVQMLEKLVTVEACVARYGRHYLLTYALH